MSFKTDIEIAQESTMLPIEEVAAKIGIGPEALEHQCRGIHPNSRLNQPPCRASS